MNIIQECFQDAFNKIKRSNVYGAALAFEELKTDVPKKMLKNIVKRRKKKTLRWNDLLNMINAAKRNHRFKASWEIKEANQLFMMIQNSANYENSMQIFLKKRNLSLFLELENKNHHQLCDFISKNYYMYPDQEPHSKPIIKFSSWNKLDNFLKAFELIRIEDANKNLTDDKITENMDDLRTIMTMLSSRRQKSDKPAPYPFSTCSFCWRFVPQSQQRSSKAFCQFHNHMELKNLPANTKSHRNVKALLKENKKLPLEERIYPVARKYSKTLRGIFDPDNINSQFEPYANWYTLWHTNPIEADKNLKFEHQWPELSTLLQYLPNIVMFFKNMNFESDSPEAIIQALCPIHPLCTKEEKEQMLAYYSIWKRNFYMFIPELAHAEAWFEAYRKKYPNSKAKG